MRKNRVKQLWEEGKATVGTWLSLGSPNVAEYMAHAGFDWVLIDMEHSAIDITTTQTMLQVVSATDTVPIVRVAGNDPTLIKCALDAGAYGVLIPMVNSRQEAIRAVEASRYPPVGIRGVAPGRTLLYAGDDYLEHANEEIAVIIQIEHIDAIDRADEILSVEGIDAYFIGPLDLAASMGTKLELDNSDPRHIEAVSQVLAVGKQHNMPAGIFAGSAEEVNKRIAQGFQFISLLNDAGLLMGAAQEALAKVTKDRRTS